jgi:acyl-CoA synthetase (AMP-forming)/AMP-acid ligase II
VSSEVRLPETIQSIPETLDFWARQTPDALAFIIPGQPAVTYAALWRGVREVAETLICSGVGRHDRVVLLLPEAPTLAMALLGTMSAAIAVPLPASLTASELKVALHNLHASAALVSPTIAAASRDCLEQCGVPALELDEDHGPPAFPSWGAAPRSAELSWPHPDDLALVCQTSGTTGRPKRVPRTHDSLVDLGTRHRNQFGIRPGDRVAFVAPMALSLGQTVLLQAVTTGSSLIFPPPGVIGRQWEIIAAERPTWLSAAAGYLELLGRYLEGRTTPVEPSSLRFVLVTSAATSQTTCKTVERELGAPVYTRYSSSEAGAIAAVLPPPAAAPKPGSEGQPIQEVQIVAADGIAVGPNIAGEIWVRGPRVFSGYLDDPEANAATFLPDGWFRTGDVGYLDADGFLYLTGRLNELINRGGEKIAPAEVDEVLNAHPAVSAAAVFAVPDERFGQDVVAAVVLERGQTATPRQLRRWMLDRLAPIKVPRRIWFLDDLPLTLSGKVQRGVLADRYVSRQGPAQAGGKV